MVTFSPWQQDPDYEAIWDVSTSTSPPRYEQWDTELVWESGWTDPVTPITEPQILQLLEQAHGGLSGPGDLGGLVISLASGYTAALPQWNAGIRAWVRERVFPVVGRDFEFSPTVDPDAIGVDYEGQPYDPDDPWAFAPATTLTLHLSAQTELEGQFTDARVIEGDLPWTSTTHLLVRPPDGVTRTLASLPSTEITTGANWAERNLPTSVDITAYGLDASTTIPFWTETPDQIVGGDPSPYNATDVGYGWLIKLLRFEAVVRPPRYRFVYDDVDEPVAYRRTFPRDDGLAGGARRTFPPSRALQSGNRTSGGYL